MEGSFVSIECVLEWFGNIYIIRKWSDRNIRFDRFVQLRRVIEEIPKRKVIEG